MILTVEVASFEEIDLTVIEKFLQDLPERALNLGIRIVMAFSFLSEFNVLNFFVEL